MSAFFLNSMYSAIRVRVHCGFAHGVRVVNAQTYGSLYTAVFWVTSLGRGGLAGSASGVEGRQSRDDGLS